MTRLQLFVVLVVLTAAAEARAQYESHSHVPQTVPAHVAIPERPLTVGSEAAAGFGGITIDLSSGNAFKGWRLPLGFGYGLLPNLEVGMDTLLLLKPFEDYTLIAEARLYGRYLLLPGLLAIEPAVYIPTVGLAQIGIEGLALARIIEDRYEVFGQAKLAYFGGFTDAVVAGGAATCLINIAAGFFGAVDLGLTFRRNMPDAIAGLAAIPASNDWVVPIAVGAGYRILPDLIAKASFTFPDVASKDLADEFNGLDRRTFDIVLVSIFDLGAAPGEAQP